MLHNFDFEAVDQKLEFLPTGLVITDKNNIRLKIAKRQKVDQTA